MTVLKSDIANAVSEKDGEPFAIGESLYVRTLTFHSIGTLKRVSQCGGVTFLHLEPAVNVVESGPFSTALKAGKIKASACTYGAVRVNLSAVVDILDWNHPIPKGADD